MFLAELNILIKRKWYFEKRIFRARSGWVAKRRDIDAGACVKTMSVVFYVINTYGLAIALGCGWAKKSRRKGALS